MKIPTIAWKDVSVSPLSTLKEMRSWVNAYFTVTDSRLAVLEERVSLLEQQLKDHTH